MYDEVYGYTEKIIVAGDTATIPIEIPSDFGTFAENTVSFTVYNETSSCNVIELVPVDSDEFSLPESFTSEMSGRYLIKFNIKNNSSQRSTTVGTRLIVNGS